MDDISLNGLSTLGDVSLSALFADTVETTTLGVDSIATFRNNVQIKGDCTIEGTLYANIEVVLNSIDVTGASSIGNTLYVLGDSTINNSLYVANNLTVGGSLAFNSFNVKNASTVENILFVRNIAPQISNTINIGSDINDNLVFSGLSYLKRAPFIDSLANKCNILLNASSTTTPSQLGLFYRDDNTYSGVFQTQGSLIKSELTSNSIMFNPLGNTGTITLKTQQNVDSNILVSHPFNSTQTMNSNLFITGSQTIGGTLTVSDATFSNNLFVNDYVKLNYNQSNTTGNKLGLLYATGTQTGLPLIANSQGHTIFKNPSQTGLTRLISSTTADNVFILVSDSDNLQNVNTNIQFNGVVTIQNTLNVDTLNVNNLNTLTKQLNIDNSIFITGSSTLLNSLTITGQTTILNSLLVTGSTTFQNNLRITGNTTIEGVLTASNAFFSGSSTVNNTLNIIGINDPSFDYESRINLVSNTQTNSILGYKSGNIAIMSNALYVSGATNFANNITAPDIFIIGNITGEGELTISGNARLGDSVTIGKTLELSNFIRISNGSMNINNTNPDTNGANLTFNKIRSSSNSLSGDTLGYISANGYNNSAYRQGAYIAFLQNGTGSSNVPTDIIFATTDFTSSNSIERIRINRNGNLGIGGSISGNPQYPLHIATSETSGIVSVSAQFSAQLAPNTGGSNRTRKWFGVNTNTDNSFFEDFYFFSNDGGTNSRFNYVGWGSAGRGYSFLSNGNGTFYIPALGGSGNQYVGVDTNGTLYKAGAVSDKRLKQDISCLSCCISKLEKLEFYKFKYKPSKVIINEDIGNGQKYIVTDRPELGSEQQYGIMAQELIECGFEDCVNEEETKLGEKYYTFDDKKLQWHFNKAIVSLIKWNKKQELKISNLETQFENKNIELETKFQAENIQLKGHIQNLETEIDKLKIANENILIQEQRFNDILNRIDLIEKENNELRNKLKKKYII